VLYGPAPTQHLAAGFPVYGLPLYLATTVETMATRLRKIIQAIQPSGPYRLAGWSFGGKLAYEISAQLIGEGATVEFAGLIDTLYAPPKPYEPLLDEEMLRHLF